MQGNLKQIQLPEVLQFISMGKSSGLLSIRDKNGLETTLTIRKGKIINSSALERQRRLGDLLVHRGILKRSVLGQLLSLQRTVESDKRLGEILVERDVVSQDTIREVLRLQLEEEIWNLFGLEEGDFHFETAEDEKLGEATLQMDIEPLLLEGTRRQDEWRKIARLLPNDRMVATISLSPLEAEPEDRLRLKPAEWKVLAQINGTFPIRAIINRSGMGRFEVCQILSSFIQRNIITIREDNPEKVAASSSAINTPVGAALAGSSKGGGVGSFFSRLTGGTAIKREERGDRLSFVSPIGSLTHFINQMTEHFLALREMRVQPGDQLLAETIWPELLVSFPKADPIQVRRNTVNCEKLEKFLKLFEFSEATQDCYEDSVEALCQLLDALYKSFASRVGEKNAARSVRELLDDIGPRVAHTYSPEFKLNERVQSVLRFAA